MKKTLERFQIPIYVAALVFGALAGLAAPDLGAFFEAAIYPILGILLYATFLEVPFSRLRAAFSGGRYMAAVLVLNFAVVPLIVWSLSRFVAGEPAVLLGVLLVLLTPCIDYVIVFSGLGGGDERLVLASTPLLMLAQMLTLPIYLWIFIGSEIFGALSAGPFLEAFLILIALPLSLAVATQFLTGYGGSAAPLARRWSVAMGYVPVPFLALTLLAVVASQVPKLEGAFGQVVGVVPIYALFLVIMAFVGRFTARVFGLGIEAARSLVFTGATRNSLVVLPLALALPTAYALTPAVVVTQTLVELVGMLVYMRFVPAWLLPSSSRNITRR